jgi:hypothetical protein
MALTAIPFGLVIGVTVGMLGGGGSVLAVPRIGFETAELPLDGTRRP